MWTVLVLVERSQPQGADVACDVVAGRDRVVADGVGADEADLDIAVGAAVVGLVLDLEILRFGGFGSLGCRLSRRILPALMGPSSSSAPPRAASASRVVSATPASSSSASASASVTVASGT